MCAKTCIHFDCSAKTNLPCKKVIHIMEIIYAITIPQRWFFLVDVYVMYI
jgi:hypothetical protein